MIFEVLKIVALASMCVDHIGVALLPGVWWLRLVGRLAFPLFALCVSAGLCYTRDKRKYALRMLLLAIITVPCGLLMRGDFKPSVNCVFGFALAAGFVWAWENNKPLWLLICSAGILLIPIDYSLFSSLYVVLNYILLRHVLAADKRKPAKRLMPRWFFYWFYPVHQFALGIFVLVL